MANRPTPSNPYRVRDGILWLLSPVVVLTIIYLINLVMRLANDEAVSYNGRILTALLGGLNVLLFIVGPIVGIITIVQAGKRR